MIWISIAATVKPKPLKCITLLLQCFRSEYFHKPSSINESIWIHWTFIEVYIKLAVANILRYSKQKIRLDWFTISSLPQYPSTVQLWTHRFISFYTKTTYLYDVFRLCVYFTQWICIASKVHNHIYLICLRGTQFFVPSAIFLYLP